MIYVIIFFGLLFASLHQSKTYWPLQNNAKQERLFHICLTALILFSGFRGKSIGIDTAGGYYTQYLLVENGVDIRWVEPAWRALNLIAVKLHMGYSGVLTLASMMTLLPVGYALQKKCRNPCYGLFIYYGLCLTIYSFNLMRQCIAIAWVFLGVYFYEKKEYAPAVMAFAVAVLFHSSAVVALPIIVFSKFKLKYLYILLSFAVSFFIGIALNERTVSMLFVLFGKYAGYLNDTDGYRGFRNNIFLPVIFTVMVNLFFLGLLIFRTGGKITDIWYKMTVLGIIVMNLTMRLGQGTRIVLYFSQAQAVFLPAYDDSLKSKQNRMAVKLLYVTFLFVNFLRNLFSQTDSLIPYRFFWMEG